MTVAVYAGSFDPITFGHLDILNKASHAFDKVYAAVGNNPAKKHIFTLEERMDMIRHEASSNIEVVSFEGSLAQFCRDYKCNFIVRGLRSVTDYEYEIQIAAANKIACPEVDTIFFLPDQKNMYISSSVAKEYFKLGEDVSSYVPKNVIDQLKVLLAKR